MLCFLFKNKKRASALAVMYIIGLHFATQYHRALGYIANKAVFL